MRGRVEAYERMRQNEERVRALRTRSVELKRIKKKNDSSNASRNGMSMSSPHRGTGSPTRRNLDSSLIAGANVDLSLSNNQTQFQMSSSIMTDIRPLMPAPDERMNSFSLLDARQYT